MGILSTLSIASQSLRSIQVAIQTTGHNLANVATPGFSRQRVDLVSTFPSFEAGLNLGQGVEAAGVRSVVDRFYETQLLATHADVGFSEAQSRAMAAVQEAFPTTGGIDAALSAFFAALSDLSLNPGGSVERVSLVGKANALGESFRQTREILASVQRHLDNDLDSAVQSVNVTLEKIAKLNRQIVLTEAEGQPANDFRDQRQVLLQEISQLTGATIREESNGQATVLAGGLLLVSGERFGSLDSSQFNAGGFHTLRYQTPDGLGLDATSLINRGEVGSMLTMRDNEVQRSIDQLDLVAETLVNAVNTRHALGFDLNGATGGEFFNSIAATAGASANVGVNAVVAANPRMIAAAQSAAATPGDNRNVLSLLNLRSTTFAALGDLTVQDSFLSLIGEVGTAAQSAQAGLDFHKSLLTQTRARRDSVSGVNIDEEMTKLILFQRTFEASSLLVRTADEMYRTLIDMAS